MARDYKREYRMYQGKPEQIHNRSLRNTARAELTSAGVVHKGDHIDVDHRRPLSEGGTNARSNLRPRSVHANRGFWKGKDRP